MWCSGMYVLSKLKDDQIMISIHSHDTGAKDKHVCQLPTCRATIRITFLNIACTLLVEYIHNRSASRQDEV